MTLVVSLVSINKDLIIRIVTVTVFAFNTVDHGLLAMAESNQRL